MNTVPLNKKSAGLAGVLERYEDVILAEWIKEMKGSVRRSDLLTESDLRAQCSELLRAVKEGLKDGVDFQSSAWDRARGLLKDISSSRAQQGFSSAETALFVFSMKRPLFTQLRQEFKNDAAALADEMWSTTELLDAMGLYTTEIYQKTREEVIRRQQEELLELSTPVVKLWDGVLALPIIGTLDSARTQIVMESLLQAIVQTNSRVAIVDITGVPTVDTIVAQHLLKESEDVSPIAVNAAAG